MEQSRSATVRGQKRTLGEDTASVAVKGGGLKKALCREAEVQQHKERLGEVKVQSSCSRDPSILETPAQGMTTRTAVALKWSLPKLTRQTECVAEGRAGECPSPLEEPRKSWVNPRYWTLLCCHCDCVLVFPSGREEVFTYCLFYPSPWLGDWLFKEPLGFKQALDLGGEWFETGFICVAWLSWNSLTDPLPLLPQCCVTIIFISLPHIHIYSNFYHKCYCH